MPDPKPPRFVYLVNRADRAIGRWVENHSAGWEGVSSAQIGLLFVLASQHDASVGEIAQALDVAPAAVTNLSKRMQDADLITRIADASDGRLTRLRLTPAGSAALDKARGVLATLNAELTNGFSKDELDTVSRWLSQVGTLRSR